MASLKFAAVLLSLLMPLSTALMPYTRSPVFDLMFPLEDPFRILEQTPFNLPKEVESVALARCDWKETASKHVISLDVPGLRKEDVKIEVEENRVLRVSGERKAEKEVEGENWHRCERAAGKFWRRFRLPANADLDAVKARLEDGVLKITVLKLAEDKKPQPKLIGIAEDKAEL
ncbi:hypothetical protein NMG60_11032449 [Bertholletia excelsa]